MKSLLLLLLFFVLTPSCNVGDDTHYIGNWERTKRRTSKLSITYDGSSYFIEESNSYGRRSKYKAELQDGELRYSVLGGLFDEVGLGKISVVYDKSVDRLYIAGDEYVRAD